MLKEFFGCALAMCLLGLGSFSGPASGLPVLQLDIYDPDGIGAHYVMSHETTVSSSETFDVYAILDPSKVAVPAPLHNTYYLVASLFQVNPRSMVADGTGLNYFTIDNVNYFTSAMTLGTPVIAGESVQTHSIFPTLYVVIPFLFSSSATMSLYDVEMATDPHNPPGHLSSTGNGYYKKFAVDVTPLAQNHEVHFDIFAAECKGKREAGCDTKLIKAPFSHDAEGYRLEDSSQTQAVPEPGALALFGSGLLGLLLWYRKKARAKS